MIFIFGEGGVGIEVFLEGGEECVVEVGEGGEEGGEELSEGEGVWG